MFIFHTEEIPHESTEYFAYADEERGGCAMLVLAGHDDIEKPRKSHNWVEKYSEIICLELVELREFIPQGFCILDLFEGRDAEREAASKTNP